MIRKWIHLFWIICILASSCSSDPKEEIPEYWVSVIQEKSFTPQDMQKAYEDIFQNNPLLTSLLKDIRVVAIRYRTKDLNGKEILASGIIAYPTDVENIKGITSMQHSTLFLKSQAPSHELLSPEILPVFFNQIVIMADYLGFGESENIPHPFMHSAITGSTCLDMLRASKEYLTLSGFKLPEEITLAGFSQGGSATLALLREMESQTIPVWNVKQVYVCSGVYDFSATYDYYLKKNHLSTPAFAPYLILGLNTNNDMNLSEIFIDPQKIQKLFDGKHSTGEIDQELGYYLNQILHPDAYTSTLNPSFKKFEQALADNNLLDWTPQVPITLMHSTDDPDVPFFNSQDALDEFQSKGCDVNLIKLKGDHSSSAISFFIHMLF